VKKVLIALVVLAIGIGFIGCSKSNPVSVSNESIVPGGSQRPEFIDNRPPEVIQQSKVETCEPVALNLNTTKGLKYALVVGISAYAAPNTLQYCDDDGRDWAARLQAEGYTVTSLIDAQATYANIDAALTTLASRAIAGNEIAFVYSGHGTNSGKTSYMISVNLQYLSSSYLATKFANAASTKMVFSLDCCKAAGFSSMNKTGRVICLASTSTYSYDGDATMQNGVYTYYQMKGFDTQGYIYMENDAAYANTQMKAWGSANHARVSPTYYDSYTGNLDL
jgi:hypothetical protein